MRSPAPARVAAMYAFCAEGSAAMMVTDMSGGPVNPSSIPTPHAIAGCTASLATTAHAMAGTPASPDAVRRSTRAAPKDSRIIGGAAAPSMDVDTSRSVGIDHPAAENMKPHSAAITMGLRATTRAMPAIDGRCPDPTRSARTKNIGVKNPS